ncbi:GNAT family N-acetyltransferase [Pontibacter sp. BT310]|uniref:GNAT family N-acetyltransferase n=1 Tax=Pontibacter populi TaxID=890055 RepID=A0ABS6XEJ8_9BACT|nr:MULTISPECIES: GNAT family N-acetyltransferase [Pontibacter]MBJ6118702.1 GNAT family N-acetyltransferase [Pontibacter sp. BT310]MBR0571131.1 GNAT family N-acetyltransferase [Microvirga sp. STS03]MBW3365556.1 GNAT family N-acetyltransferase [Pontibacter populi]
MLTLTRTTSDNPDFQSLVVLLDQDLEEKDGDDHAFYAQYNKVDAIKEVIIAYKDGVVAGCGAIKSYTETIVEVKRMFVHPDFRRQGIAKQILTALEDWAKELNYTATILETGMKQAEAIELYKNSGYTVIPNYGQYAGVENSVCMQKQLS